MDYIKNNRGEKKMKFIRAHIFGFGKWVDTTFDFTSSSFLTYFGENESGKSTLQQFLSYMLFGLPPRQRQFFQPKHSSRFGGTLRIESDLHGVFTIERTAHEFACYLQNDDIKDEAWLHEALHGLTRDTYESIYSFSALDLSEIQQMKVQQLNQVLFSVGLTGSTNIYQMEKDLDTQIGQLYKAKGWKPQLNEQLKIVQKKHEQLLKLEKEEHKYMEKKQLKQEMEVRLQESAQQLEKLQKKLQMNEKLLHVIPLRQQYEQLKNERNNYGELRPFPEDGLTRLQQLKEHYLPLQSEQRVIATQSDEYEQQIKKLQEEVYENTIFQSLQTLASERIQVEQMQAEGQRLVNEMTRIQDALDDKNELIPIEQKDIEEVVLPFHMEAVVAEIEQLEEEVRKESQWLQEELQYIEKELERLNILEKEAKQGLLSETEAQKLKNENALYEQVEREKNWTNQNEKAMEALYEKNQQQSKITVIIASLLAILLIGLTVWQKESMYGIFAIIVAAFAIWHWKQSKEKNIPQNSSVGNHALPFDTAHFLENERKLKQDEERKTAIHLINNELKHANFQQIQLEEKLHTLQERESHLTDRVETERYQYPFLAKVEPKYWVKLIDIVRDMKRLFIEKQTVADQLTEVEKDMVVVEEQLTQLARDLVLDELTLPEVTSLYEGEKEKHEQLDRLAVEKLRQEEQLQQLAEKISVYEQEKNALFMIAQTDEEEMFYRIAYENEKINELDKQLQDIKSQMEQLFYGDEITQLWQSTATIEELESEIFILKSEQEDLLAEAADMNRMIAAIEIEIEQLEQSGSLSDVHFSYEMEKNKLNELAEQYAVLKVAQLALQQAKETYQETYFHRVIKQTSTYFSYITNGRYIKVYAPTEKELFQVEANNNIRYTIEELSKGTIDQVYVSLRLAMNTVMQEKVRMPLMIDDAFVHFDEKRKQRMIQLLEKISKSQQVIFFTCIEDRVISGKVRVEKQSLSYD